MNKLPYTRKQLKNGETLIIREAEKADVSSIIAHFNQAAGETDYLTFGPGEFYKTIEEEEKTIEEYKDSLDKFLLVSELDKFGIVATLRFRAKDKPRLKHAAEFSIVIQKEHWGKGIASILIRSMLEWAISSNTIKKISLNVRSDHSSAISLYEKLGFQKEGLIRRHIYMNGIFYDSYCMGMLIDHPSIT